MDYTALMIRNRVRLCPILLLLIAAAGCVAFAAAPEKWIELRSPNFIAVSNANENRVRGAVYQFEVIGAVFREFFNLQGSSPDPPVIILAAKDANTFKQLLPEYDWTTKGSAHPAGIYVGGPEKNYVGMRLDLQLSPGSSHGTTLSSAALDKLRVDEKLGKEAYADLEPVYREYIHFLMRQTMPPLPLWLMEGLAQFYGSTRVGNKAVFVGAPNAANTRVLLFTRALPQSPR